MSTASVSMSRAQTGLSFLFILLALASGGSAANYSRTVVDDETYIIGEWLALVFKRAACVLKVGLIWSLNARGGSPG